MSESNKLYTPQFAMLCLSGFLFFTGFNMIIPELPDYLASLGGEEYKGLIIALFTITAGVSRPFSGKLTDRIGRVPVMVFGAVVSACCAILYPFVSSVAGFLSLRFIHGMSTGFKPTGTSAIVADIVPLNRRGEGTGMLGLFSGTGMAFGPFIGSEITQTFSLNTMFYCSSACAILSVLVLVRIKETLAEPEPFSPGLLKISFVDFFEKRVIPSSFVLLFTVYSFGMLLTVTPTVGSLLGMENKGLYFASFIASSLLIRFIGGKASDKFGRVPVLIVSNSLLTIALVITGFAQESTQYLAGAIIYGLGIGLNHPTIIAWTIDLADKRFVGRGFATMFIALEMGIGSGAFLGGTFFPDNLSGFLTNCLVAAGLNLVPLAYLIWLKLTNDSILITKPQ